MTAPVSVIVPARNEAQTIARVVSVLADMPDVGEVVVVDNGSTDATAELARGAGATVISETQTGMGHAVRAGVSAARHDWVMKVDADLDRFDTDLFSQMPAARGPGVGLIKGAWHDPADNMPMTRLLVRPALHQMFPGLSHLRAPNSGLYVFDRSLIAYNGLATDYAVDLDIMLRVHAAGYDVAEVDIGRIVHDTRDVTHYNGMAEQIFAFFLSRQPRMLTREMVVLAQDGAQVIHHALGTIGHRLAAGVRVTVYLEDMNALGSRVLHELLGAYPTVRVLPLDDRSAFSAHANATGLCVLAPYPRAGGGSALSEAVALFEVNHDHLPGAVWLMPVHDAGREITGFAPDMLPEVADGLALKQAALGALGVSIPPLAGLARELFQSYASLPDALRPAYGSLAGHRHPSVGNF
ncbi:glycosyltransferase [Roseovarius mucosus]|uniref:glycosyltransferase n=1 Tax=Roseovarius mucosus TaxID=215743 RepID=UPI0035CF5426|tara:strand:+ start:721 stop:1950 length:1230 start_codon:yes stop_codon:yes gene_type:complete